MSDLPASKSGPARLVAYPDDEEANIFTTDPLRVYCEHTIDQERRMAANTRSVFEVVPPLTSLDNEDAPKKGKKGAENGPSGKEKQKEKHRQNGRQGTETVTLLYSSEDAPKLTQAPEGESDKSLEKRPPEGGVPRYALECTAYSPDLAILEKEFWQKLKEPRVYQIEGIGDEPFEIKAYCPDRFTLETDFPALGSISGGVKIEERVEEVSVEEKTVTAEVEKTSWSPTSQRLKTVDASVEEGPDGTTVERNRDEQTAPTEMVRLRRNDRYVEADVAKLASSGLQLAAQVQKVIELVQDNVPKFGWYVEASVHVMRGTLSLKWGWREYAKAGQEHKAFYWLALNADVAILQASLELGVGVESLGFKLQVFGRIQGAVMLKTALQRVSPDGDAGVKAHLKGEIAGELGARFEAPYVVKAEGKVKSKLIVEGEARARQDDGLRLTLDTYWNGISAVVTWSTGAQTEGVGTRKEGSRSIEVISPPPGKPGYMLGQWTWPEGSRYEPERIPRSEVKAVFKDIFKAGHVVIGGKWNIRVREHGRRQRRDYSLLKGSHTEPDYTWWPLDEVIEPIVEKIEQRPYLKRTRKSVEAMAIEIRDRLQTMMQEHGKEYSEDVPSSKRQLPFDWKKEGTTPHLRAADYEAFLESDDFQELLGGYVDPIQKQMSKIEKEIG